MHERYDVLVVGAGPAGLTAAQAAASRGARVGLLDAQVQAGGQVWRHDVRHAPPAVARRAIEAALSHPGIEWLAQTRVVLQEHDALLLEDNERAWHVRYGALILANGARELLLPFPGWTLPGVTGTGGLQALGKQGWPLAGKKVVIGGSGPLLLAAAATAKRHGATVLSIHEQASAAQIHRFARGLWRWPSKAWQAAMLRTTLAGVPYHTGSVVRRALGGDALQGVEIDGPHGRRQIACDQLAAGYGLVPNVELAQMLGCELRYPNRHACVSVDDMQRTSLANVFAAGEVCGIGGRDSARIEGAIAGYAAVGDQAQARQLLPARQRTRRFADALATHFALDPRVLALADSDTLICRCEDVPLSALDAFPDARSAKLATRCGMGACQGRICGSALAELSRFPRGGIRPPLFPARLSTLGTAPFDPESQGVHP
ncbi:FAD-binding protein [Rhodanobacter glycinis]|uniref:FAD-binding protein n=1 Tax=Rhodanobacter glycinis TaxID=582702 RepID=A0A5B9DWR0_9GAMM|nr:FAD-dependent oxidoreductase [Rhodanobacter glycinis]QEE24423.1 FAD-binding protein [Rhodanobacter glycinis]